MGRDSGSDPLGRLDRNREVGAVARAVLLDHRLQAEAQGVRFGDRHADQAAAVLGEEVDLLGGDEFGGENQIALLLPVLAVHPDDDFSSPAAAHYLRTPSPPCMFAS